MTTITTGPPLVIADHALVHFTPHRTGALGVALYVSTLAESWHRYAVWSTYLDSRGIWDRESGDYSQNLTDALADYARRGGRVNQ